MKNAIQLSMFNLDEALLIYRSKAPSYQRRFIKSSKNALDVLLQSWNPDTLEQAEEFKLLLMNRSNSVLGILAVSKGELSSTVTDVRLIFQVAIKGQAIGIIACHNHP